MRKYLTFSFLIVLFSCKQKQLIVETSKPVNDIENYVNKVESFIHHINISTKDADSISIGELNFIKNSHHITLNISDKYVTFRNNKIVKVKYRDYLENNFIKVKSFYYDKDDLVCVRIYELLPTDEQKGEIYKRIFYFKENKLLLDSNKSDDKYHNANLLSFGIEKLEEEYQSKIND